MNEATQPATPPITEWKDGIHKELGGETISGRTTMKISGMVDGKEAMIWIDRHGRSEEVYRFDVVGVVVGASGFRVRHVENAFSLESRT